MSHLVSCYTNCYGASGVWTAVEKIREAGLDHIELALRSHAMGGLVIPESAVITEKTDDETAKRFVDHLQKHRVKVSGCNVGGADIRTDEGRETTEQRIRFAARWFNATICVSGAGQPTNDEERRSVIGHLRSIGQTAADCGIVVCLETHKGPTENAQAMLNIIGDVDHPNIRLNFDTGNIAYYNRDFDPCDELEKVKHLVRNVHVKDNRGGFEDWYFPAVGDGGHVNFVRVRKIMEEIGYDGAYTIEIEGIGGEAEPSLEARHERVARSISHLRACGYLGA